jgi:hypothetical protein
MIGPDVVVLIAIAVLIVGRPSGFQLLASDQRLFPSPLSHVDAKAPEAIERSKTTEINATALINIQAALKTVINRRPQNDEVAIQNLT